MLAVFREKSVPDNVELVEGRMESFDLGDRHFRLITAPFRAMQHLLDVGAQLSALERIRQHLTPGGRFVFDVFDPKLARMAIREEPEDEGTRFMYGGVEMRRRETVRRDPSTQVMTIDFRLEGGPPELQGRTRIKMRWYYRYELEHLLARAGFSKLEFHGFKGAPWQPEKDTVVVARKKLNSNIGDKMEALN
jgi:SAM-dependent methyltransferase